MTKQYVAYNPKLRLYYVNHDQQTRDLDQATRFNHPVISTPGWQSISVSSKECEMKIFDLDRLTDTLSLLPGIFGTVIGVLFASIFTWLTWPFIPILLGAVATLFGFGYVYLTWIDYLKAREQRKP